MHPATAKRERDLRLDFFRGMGMFIIYMAHLPGNSWTLWIPARFGFSDATEIFVFCSGMASAIAFGRVFDSHGWWMGAARVGHRVWQVYWAHIALFLVIAAQMVLFEWIGQSGRSSIGQLNLFPFFENTQDNLIGLLTLTYVPNYFDILPMYLVILVLLPFVVGLSWISPYAAGAFVVGLWLAATMGVLDLPAEPWSDRPWFFNPFAWQLIFFTGFAFIRGWLPAPPVNRWLVYGSIGIILLSLPIAYERMWWAVPFLEPLRPDIYAIREALSGLIAKTEFGLFRYIHFLAIAYLAYVWAGPKGSNLPNTGLAGRFVEITRRVGQQSLAVFLASLVIGQGMGFVLREVDNGILMMAFVNVAGFVLLYGVARLTSWYKSEPWRRQQNSQPVDRSRTVSARSSGQMAPGAAE